MFADPALQRSRKACISCRQRKRKCEGEYPCTYCVRNEHECRYEKGRKKHKRRANPQISQEEPNTPDGKEEDNSQLLFLEANFPAAFVRQLGLKINPTLAPRLNCYAWNLGLDSEETIPVHSPSLPEILSLEKMHHLTNSYFQHVAPVYNFLDREHIETAIFTCWSNQSFGSSAESMLSGIAALGCLFGGRQNGLETRLVRSARNALEYSSTLPCPEMDHVIGWLLRVIFLRATSSPQATWMACCTLMHMVETTQVHLEPSKNRILAQSGNSCPANLRRRVYWIAQLFNTWVSLDYGKSPVELRGASTELPGEIWTKDQQELCSISCYLGQQSDLESSDIDSEISDLAALTPPQPMLQLLKCNIALCFFRRARALGRSIAETSTGEILKMSSNILGVVTSLVESASPWWHILNIPFQIVCVCLIVDTDQALRLLGEALAILKKVHGRYMTRMTKESYDIACLLVNEEYRRRASRLEHLKDAAVGHMAPVDLEAAEGSRMMTSLDFDDDLLLPPAPAAFGPRRIDLSTFKVYSKCRVNRVSNYPYKTFDPFFDPHLEFGSIDFEIDYSSAGFYVYIRCYIAKMTFKPIQDEQPSAVPQWKRLAQCKRQAQDASIPIEWRLAPRDPIPKNPYEYLKTSGLLSPQEIYITEHINAKLLVQKMITGQLTAEEVVTAFCKRAALTQQLIKCCTEMFFDRAIEQARGLDKHLRDTGRPVGPLHGLPISFKDVFDVEGQDTTWGWVSLIGKPSKQNCFLIDILIAQGAVPYVKTNVSQSLMMTDSYNHVFKQSLHSHNTAFTSGGSSGGEGALVGCRGSVLGIGTDIGGSVRFPANIQGLYGLFPTIPRIPLDDSGKREFLVNPAAGPIASSLESIELFMDSLAKGRPEMYDPACSPLMWSWDLAKIPQRPLRIGYYVNDGNVRVQPPIEAAVRDVIHALKSAGHEVFEWDCSTHGAAYKMWEQAMFADGGEKCRQLAEPSGEPLIEGLIMGTEKTRLSIAEAESFEQSKTQYQRNYLRRWADAGLDALIMPVQPWVSFQPKVWVRSKQYLGYTAHWNLCNFASLTVPVTTAMAHSPSLKAAMRSWENYKPHNESDQFNWDNCKNSLEVWVTTAADIIVVDPDLVRDMPVGIQIVGGHYGEEKAVAVAKAVEKALKEVV
ncbi:unnamed protein product [Penicillium olsonii]|nr:unnamed protein product [Penicillium olsonii]